MTNSSLSPYISIDWGTSRFRLRVIDRSSAKILAELQTDQGIKPMFERWLESGKDRVTFYLQYAYDQLKTLDHGHDLPIIISGMASSSIGMVELPYAPLPFSCQGQGLNMEKIENNLSLLVYLISGVASNEDVMRGEETQLIGIYESPANLRSKVCYVFPGTHSKHIFCQDDQVIDFHTYMTGEIFETIKEHTILKQSIETGPLDHVQKKAFLKGVDDAISENLLHSLFKIRASHILQTREKSANAYYLSGLLIGSELADLKKHTLDSVFLCAQDYLQELYTLAASSLNLNLQKLIKPLEKATILGQLKMLSLISRSETHE